MKNIFFLIIMITVSVQSLANRTGFNTGLKLETKNHLNRSFWPSSMLLTVSASIGNSNKNISIRFLSAISHTDEPGIRPVKSDSPGLNRSISKIFSPESDYAYARKNILPAIADSNSKSSKKTGAKSQMIELFIHLYCFLACSIMAPC